MVSFFIPTRRTGHAWYPTLLYGRISTWQEREQMKGGMDKAGTSIVFLHF
jgi:hypothetical protein